MRHLAIVALWVLAGGAGAATASGPPVAPVEPVTDTYFGTKVADPYRWMEDRAAPRFVGYLMKESAYARGVLDAVPGRDALQARIAAHTGGGVTLSQVQTAGGRVFYLKRGPSENTFKLYVRDAPGGSERLLLDPDKGTAPGRHFAIDYYQPSADGARLAYGISPGGSEQSVIHTIDVVSGAEGRETIDRGEFGSPSWLPDGSGFFYTRTVARAPGESDTDRYLNSRVYLHRLGADPAGDVALVGAGVAGSPAMAPQDVAAIVVTPGSDFALAIISHGAELALELHVAPLKDATGPSAPWRKIADSPDGVVGATLHGAQLYLLTHKDAPRYEVIKLDAAAPDLSHATVVVPAGERVVEDMEAASDGLYIRDLDGGLGRARRYDYATGALVDLALPSQGSVTGPFTDPVRPGALLGLQGWVTPQSWFTAQGGKVAPLALIPPWSEDLSAYVAEETKVAAPDGRLIPLSIVHRRGLAQDGKAPVWLTGYGAYGVALKPSFASTHLTLMDDGGVLAVIDTQA